MCSKRCGHEAACDKKRSLHNVWSNSPVLIRSIINTLVHKKKEAGSYKFYPLH